MEFSLVHNQKDNNCRYARILSNIYSYLILFKFVRKRKICFESLETPNAVILLGELAPLFSIKWVPMGRPTFRPFLTLTNLA